MRLVVLACDAVTQPPGDSPCWVLRLVGMPRASETPPPSILRAADEAAAQVRATFPGWLWQWISTHGTLELQVWPGPISWWWFTPLSEKSPLRSRLIRELYWVTLLRVLFTAHRIDALDWYGDDPALAAVVAELAAQCGVPAATHLVRGRRASHWRRALAQRVRYTVSQAACWVFLRALGFAPGRRRPADSDVLLYSRFPILWEAAGAEWHERMFGSWPAHLEAAGHRVGYAAVFSGSPAQLIRERHRLRDRCVRQNILLLETTLSLAALLRAHAPVGFFRRYFAWRTTRRREKVQYAGLNVSVLFWRELDANALSPEIPFDRTTQASWRELLGRSPRVKAVFLPFEYQPMERAVCSGVKQGRDIPVIGVQTGLYKSNQMGLAFPLDEMHQGPQAPLKAPLPDAVAAYGELSHGVYSQRFGENRVCLVGPLRYPELRGDRQVDIDSFRSAHDLPENARFVLVATSIAPEESIPLLEGTFAVAAESQGVFLLLKFHYHLPLHAEVRRLAAKYQQVRYRVFDADLYSLMRLAPAMVGAGSSTSIEALVFGCMPVLFRAPGEMSVNPLLDVPDAGFFWHTLDELRAALRACLERDAEYQRRRAAWPQAISAHLFQLDGLANERFYRFLRAKGVL